MSATLTPAREAAQRLLELLLCCAEDYKDILPPELGRQRAGLLRAIDLAAEPVFDPDADDDLAIGCTVDLCDCLAALMAGGTLLEAHPRELVELCELMDDFSRALDLHEDSRALAQQAIEKAMRKEGGAR